MTIQSSPSRAELLAYLKKGAENFNQGLYWEAHNDWETVWKHVVGQEKVYLQAMILICGVGYHLKRSHPNPAFKLARNAQVKLGSLGTGYASRLGLSVSQINQYLEELLKNPSAAPDLDLDLDLDLALSQLLKLRATVNDLAA